MAGSISVTVSANFDRWREGLRSFGDDTADAARAQFQQAGDVFLAETQNRVHVITGDLLSTGRVEQEQSGSEISTSVVYGGRPGASTGRIVDYAIHEENRGGSHAFMSLGWAATERMFAEAIPDAWEQVVDSWN